MKAPMIAAASCAALMLAACSAPGGDEAAEEEQQDPSEISTTVTDEDVTLIVWDQEVRGGQNEQMTKLNEAFEAAHPNVTIDRNSQSFDDLQSTLRLALTGGDAPDVVQANNARSMMGQFVSAGQVRCLDDYSRAYGWADRYTPEILSYSSYSDDGATFGEGCVYGLPQVGEVVGIYYSPSRLEELGLAAPTSWEELTGQLEEIKAADEVPLVLGNVEKWPAIHVFGLVQGQHVDADEIRTLGFGNPGGNWETEGNIAAATELADWASKGYFGDGFNGADYDAAWQEFANGRGVYLIAGSWLAPDLAEAMDDVAFMLPPSGQTTGGTGLPFAITSASQNPDVAAAYLDFITSDEAMKILAETGNVPVNNTADYTDAAEGVEADVFTAFTELTEAGGVLPYLDYATDTMDQVLGDALQELLDGRLDPQDFTSRLQGTYESATE